MPTGRDTIKRSLRIAGALAQGETPNNNEENEALTSLKGMIHSWENKGITVYASVYNELDLVSGTATYTIGSGGTFDTTRPNHITGAYVEDGSGYDYPVFIIDERKYNNILDKTTQGRPEYLYYYPEYPLGILKLYYVPDSSNWDLHIWGQVPLTDIALTTNYDYPPGYDDAIAYNLALRLCPEYGKPVTPELLGLANDALTGVINLNVLNNAQEAQLEVTSVQQPVRRNILTF